MIKSLIPILKEHNDQILTYKEDTTWGKPFNAFDGILKGNTISFPSGDNYIGYNFKKKTYLCSYRVYPWYYGSGSGRVNCPTGWTLQGSNNNTEWFDIEKVDNLDECWGCDYKDFVLKKPARYQMFRLFNITAVGYISLYQLQFCGYYNSNKYLIKQNNKYYSIKSQYYDPEKGYLPCEENFLKNGFNFLSDLTDEKDQILLKGKNLKINEGSLFEFNLNTDIKHIIKLTLEGGD